MFLAAVHLLGLVRGLRYPVEGGNSWGDASSGVRVRILVGISDVSAIEALGQPSAIPMRWCPTGQEPARVMTGLPGTDAKFWCHGFLRPLQVAVRRIFPPFQVSD